MFKPRWIRRGLAVLALTLPCTAAWAGQDGLLASEKGFVERMGKRAVPVAPGVYEVVLVSGERFRIAFGEAGRRHDLAWLESRVREIEAAPEAMAKSRELSSLRRAVESLAEEPAEAKAAVTGNTCNYPYSLDGGHQPQLVGGTTRGTASIGLDLDFGPFPPSYPKRSAYSFVATSDGTYYVTQDDYDEVPSGLGVASTSVQVNCGYAVWSCASWESFNWVRDHGCANGYRSIHRAG